jgi:hypothetical protein
MAPKRPKSARVPRDARKSRPMDDKTTEPADLRVLARDAALAALTRLADLSRSDDERVALAATQELLNRAFGKSATVGAEESPAAQPLIIKIVKFGEADNTYRQGGGES